MNPLPPDAARDHADALDACALESRLRFALRELRRDEPPANDLWPGIAARIAHTPQRAPRPHAATTGQRLLPWALAASMVLAVGIAWQLRPPAAAPDARTSPLAQEAAALTREYEAALTELDHAGPADDAALRELDRSAATIRAALARDPDARFLLDRLQHTYRRRLSLTQRLLQA